jgi:hypothetical protein
MTSWPFATGVVVIEIKVPSQQHKRNTARRQEAVNLACLSFPGRQHGKAVHTLFD